MNLADKLRKFAEKLEAEADEVLAEAQESNPAAFQQIANAVAMSSVVLEKTAENLEQDGNAATISLRLLEQIAATAEALDKSDDPALQKQASVLDELLVTLSAPKGAVAQAKRASEDELNRLRSEYRTKAREDLYTRARDMLNKQNRVDKVRKAVESKIEPYRPLQGSLSTRYPPDMPGGHLTRISDGVYQDVTTGKIYNYHAGYTTNKGNQIPGTSVQNQTRDLGDDRMGHTIFNTRENIMSRFAELDDNTLRVLAEAVTSVDVDSADDVGDAVTPGKSVPKNPYPPGMPPENDPGFEKPRQPEVPAPVPPLPPNQPQPPSEEPPTSAPGEGQLPEVPGAIPGQALPVEPPKAQPTR